MNPVNPSINYNSEEIVVNHIVSPLLINWDFSRHLYGQVVSVVDFRSNIESNLP